VARPSLDLYLQDIYRTASELLAVFLSSDYEKKEWCGLEWRAVRDLIKSKEHHRVVLFRLDGAPVSGVLSIDGYMDIQAVPDSEVAQAILTRLR
jgi:hypothetical protein